MLRLQQRILGDAAVQRVVGWQQRDGWLARDFHGAESMESGIRLLCEKGVDPGSRVLVDAFAALERSPDRMSRGLGTVGDALDALGFGGARTIRATLFAHAGNEDVAFVRDEVEDSVACFRAVLAVGSAEELVEVRRGRSVYRAGLRWPSIYHLRLLALTRGWRTPTNRSTVAEATARLVDLSPLPRALVRSGSRLIAPASFCMDDFNPDMGRLDDAGWMMWFHRMELLARLGVVREVPALWRQAHVLEQMLDAGGGAFRKPLSHRYFRTWGPYTGLMLERDWRDPARRVHDLTFRSLIILRHAVGLPDSGATATRDELAAQGDPR